MEETSEPEKRPASRIPVVSITKNKLVNRIAPTTQPSRLPTFEYGKVRPSLANLTSVSPKTASLLKAPKTMSEHFESSSIITEEISDTSILNASTVSALTPSKIPSPRTVSSTAEVAGEAVSNVPPPLPESSPPQLPSNVQDRIKSTRRKTYAVFPSESMLKKSLPRRIRRPVQLQQYLNAAEITEPSS